MNHWIRTIVLLCLHVAICNGQLLQPASVEISNKTYQVVYLTRGGFGKPATALLQTAEGSQGTALFLFRTNATSATLSMKTGEGYLLTLTPTSTNLSRIPKLPAGGIDAITNAPPRIGKLDLRAGSLVVADAANPISIDVLVLYTASAAARVGGDAAIITLANQAAAEANQAFLDSQVYVTVNLVGIVPVNPAYTESGSLATELGRVAFSGDGYMEEAQTLRNQYGADMVSLLCNARDPYYAGIGYLLPAGSDLAYTAIEVAYIVGHYVFAHELGHNLGCHHDRANATSPGFYPYSYGYNFLANNVRWGTVMSYPGVRLGYFSNPNVSFLGVPVGTANENNALGINQRAAAIAALRSPPTATLTLTKNGNGSILLGGTNVSGSVTVPRGSVLNLSAQGNFLAWSGTQTSLSTSIQVVMTNNTALMANFQDGTTPLAPFIAKQPLSQNLLLGTTLTLSVTGYGIPAPKFAWYKDELPLGVSTSTLTIPEADFDTEGLYYCIVSNSAGVVQSSTALVNVGNAPSFVQQPVSQIAEVGGNALFSVVVDTLWVTYQWHANGVQIPGATNRELLLTGIKSSDMTSYFVDVTIATCTSRSAEASLLLATPPNITQQPQRFGLPRGQSANLTVDASGFMPLLYQWLQNGIILPGATNSFLTLDNIQSAEAGSYQVQISNPQGITTSTNASVSVYDALAITLQPTNTSAAKGSTPIFYVAATGTAPVTYQWFRNGVSLTNQVYSSCRLQNVQLTNAGTYHVVINNPAGTLNSTPATLTVLDPPVIPQQPQNLAADLGAAATFTVSATGRTPMSYQWSHNSALIPGATGSSLSIPATAPDDAGRYQVVVENPDGSVTSSAATLSVNMPPAISSQPRNNTGTAGGNASFYVTATGVAPLSYYWTFNGSRVGGNAADLTLGNLQTNQAGSYSVTVSNRLGTCSSTTATLVVKDPPRITIPATMSVDEGKALTLTPSFQGRAPMTYVWSKNGTTLAGQTSAILVISNFQSSLDGDYAVTASNPDGSATSDGTAITTYMLPRLVSAPTDRSIPFGNTAAFTASTLGGAPLSHQWRFEGVTLPGATNASLSIPLATLTNEGTYVLTVTNRIGSTSSVPVRLSISFPPLIIVQPVALTVTQGFSTNLSVTVQGRAPMTYSWSLNNAPIPGATNSTLSLPAIQTSHAGDYRVVVSNADGTDASLAARLTVIIPPSITTQPSDSVVTKGNSAVLSALVSSLIPCTYQWTFNGAPLPGATSQSLTLAGIQLNQAGLYQLTAISTAGSVASRAARITVKDPPSFILQPVNTTVRLGETLTLSSSATSEVIPITYQWYKGGSAILGQTGSSLVIPGVEPTIAGTYTVKASNSDGTASSGAVSVSFQTQPPTITTDLPATLAIDPDADLQLTVGVTGRAPLTYSWTFKGVALPGQTGSTLLVPNVQTNHAGAYQVTVTNPDGSARSTATVVTVLALPPTLTRQPASATVVRGASATYSVGCLNPIGVSFQWYKNHSPIAGATNSSLILQNVADADVASYNVEVVNAYGLTASAVAGLTLINPPVITTDVQDALVLRGVSTVLSIGVQTSGTTTWQWMFNGANLSGATVANLTIVGSTNAEGSYRVRVANEAGSVTSRTATVTLKIPTTILTQPASLAIKPGEQASFSVVATGRGTLSYQWSWNGTPLPGATGAVLSLGAVETSSAGSYAVSVTGMDGSAGSQAAILNIDNPPAISIQPQDVILFPTNRSATLTVSATSSTPLTYQWQFGGTNLAGATSSKLAILNATAQQEGMYQVSVENAVAKAVSRQAWVRVSQPPVISLQPVGGVVAIGSSFLLATEVTGRLPLTLQWQKQGVPIPGATGSTLAISSIKSTDFGSYQLLATNVDGTATSLTASLSHDPADQIPPAILSQPANVTAIAGSGVTLSVVAAGTAPLTCQWKRNGVNLAGATGASLSLGSLTSSHQGAYSVGITNAYGGVLSASAQLSILYPPGITSQPVSITSTQGCTLTLRFSATNATSCLWMRDGIAVATTEATSLTLSNIQAWSAGTYSVLCSNGAGSVSTQPFTVTVCVPPSIITQPAGTSASVGGTATFTVVAGGTPPLSYAWYSGECAISGKTSSTLVLTNIKTSNEGYYSVRITNPYGKVTSGSVPLAVKDPPVITTQPAASKTLNPGATLSLSISATGRSPLSYQWFKDGAPLQAGGNSSCLSVANVQPANAGTYFATVANSDGSATSQSSAVAVNTAPYFPGGIGNQNPAKGTTLILQPAISGTTPMSYQWKRNGSSIAGATTASLTITNIQFASEGTYSIFASNVAGSASFNISLVNVFAPPSVIQAPVTASVFPGSNHTFTATLDGRTPLTYQWYKDGSPVAGANSSNHVILAAQTAHAGNYYVNVVNSDGAVNTSPVALTVLQRPSFTTHPRGGSIPFGKSTNLYVAATSTLPVRYQWHRNGNPLSGATSAGLAITNAQVISEGGYFCTASNAVGVSTSTVATITIIYPPAVVSNPAGRTVNQGGSVDLEVTVSGREPMTYSWTLNGQPIGGVSSRILSIQNIQPSQAGTYACIVRNADGTATSAGALITVRQLPVITQSPETTIVTVTNAFTLQVIAIGTGTLTYQWNREGTNIAGATRSSYSVLSATYADAGTYFARVANANGTVASDPAVVLVLPPQPILIPTNSLQPGIARLIPIADGSKGVVFYGCVGQTLIIQASTDLKVWTPLQALTVTRNPVQFVDRGAMRHPKRYSRLQVQ